MPPLHAAAVRPARPSDAPAIVALLASIYREGHGFVGDGPPSTGALRARLRGADPSRSFFAVAVPRDAAGHAEVWGWLELHRLQAARLEHVAMLTLAVDVRHRRQGLGRRLLRAGHQWAARAGVRKISLHVRAGNLAAIHLYEREGYAHEGCERGQIRAQDGFEDNLIMGRFIEPDDAAAAARSVAALGAREGAR